LLVRRIARNLVRLLPLRIAMSRVAFSLFFGLLFGVAAGVRAETLPLPPNLTALDTAEGEALLLGAESRGDFLPLSRYFVTQANPAFCGPASIVMVLNALGVPGPASPMTAGFGIFDQDNVFNARTEAVRARAAIENGGMTLDQLAGILASYQLKITVKHASDSGVDEFRKLAIGQIDAKDSFVLVNYLRSAIGQQTSGHISPLAAYDADTDKFLILDVSRYKYPPIWIAAGELFAAMNTPDSDNGGRSRGYVLVGR
jgi:hypothetical protein